MIQYKVIQIPYEVKQNFALDKRYYSGDIFYYEPNNLNHKRFVLAKWIVPIESDNSKYKIDYIVGINNSFYGGEKKKYGDVLDVSNMPNLEKLIINGTIVKKVSLKLETEIKNKKTNVKILDENLDYKIHEIAKCFNISSKEVWDILSSKKEGKQIIGEKRVSPVKIIKQENIKTVNFIILTYLNNKV